MERFITDERTGIDYELIGDYYYPCLIAPESPSVGRYGRMRQRYLRENRRATYFQMLTSGTLGKHLEQTDTEATDMMERLVKQMAKAQGVTEKLKADDMMKWVGLMNNIRACAEEIVLSDLIYA